MAGKIFHVQRETAVSVIAEAWNVSPTSLARLSAVELDRILCSADVAVHARRILHRDNGS